MTRRDTAVREPHSRRRALAFALLVGGALLFTWPFVRVPRLHVVPAYLHLLVAWAAVVLALAVLARSFRSARGRRVRAPGTGDA